MIKVLIEGSHKNTYHDGWYEIDKITSSVTLIKTNKHTILVDTGTLAYRDKLHKELQKENVNPEDVDMIFNTHYHLDHTSNNTQFPNAKQFSMHGIFDLKTKNVCLYQNKDIFKKFIPPEIEYFETPGHFCNHMSVLYNSNNKKYVMAGDVIREDIIRGTGISYNNVSEILYKSMKIIFQKADVIIPGHGGIIEGKLFDELKFIALNEFPKKHGIKS